MSGLNGSATRSWLKLSTILLLVIACALASPASAQKKSTTKKPAATTTAATAPKTRMEHDLLGNKEVPFDAYYGVQTARALENFQLSGIAINRYPGYVEAWAIVKLAAARANTAVGAMKPERLAMIEKACQAVRDGKYHDQFQVDWYQGGAGTSTNMHANEVLANVGLELVEVLAVAYRLAGLLDHRQALRLHRAHRGVRPGRRQLHDGPRLDVARIAVDGNARELEVLERPSGLDAVVGVERDLLVAEEIVFHARLRRRGGGGGCRRLLRRGLLLRARRGGERAGDDQQQDGGQLRPRPHRGSLQLRHETSRGR